MTQEKWGQLRQRLLKTVGQNNYKTWIEPLEFAELEDGVAIFHVPTSFMGNYVNQNFSDLILYELATSGETVQRLSFQVAANSPVRPAAKGAAIESVASAPEAPLNLTLELVANGIKVEWEPSPSAEPVTYAIYRDSAAQITSVADLAPLAAGLEQTLAVDPWPSPDEHCYTVTAADAAGNESEPCASVYLNFTLLPAASLKVVQSGSDAPQITWTHPGGDIAGYDLYSGDRDSGV